MNDFDMKARSILASYTHSMMVNGFFKPKNNRELKNQIATYCSEYLTEGFLEGVYSPTEYSEILDSLSKIISSMF